MLPSTVGTLIMTHRAPSKFKNARKLSTIQDELTIYDDWKLTEYQNAIEHIIWTLGRDYSEVKFYIENGYLDYHARYFTITWINHNVYNDKNEYIKTIRIFNITDNTWNDCKSSKEYSTSNKKELAANIMAMFQRAIEYTESKMAA